MARYGRRREAALVMSGLLEAASHFSMRLPELFCGFARGLGQPPIAYPVACMPQAWAAGSVFMLLQACLGLELDGWSRALQVDEPCLPYCVDSLTVTGLELGDDRFDLAVRRSDDGPARVSIKRQPPSARPVPGLSIIQPSAAGGAPRRSEAGLD